jgi:hypothetical protein
MPDTMLINGMLLKCATQGTMINIAAAGNTIKKALAVARAWYRKMN